MKVDQTVRTETTYVLIWVLLLSAIMESVFLILGQWDISVLAGNLVGAAAAAGNFFLLAMTVVKLVNSGETETFKQRMHASKSMRQLGMLVFCILGIVLLKTNVYATLIPLIFPRIGLGFKQTRTPKSDSASEDEGSDLT